ncbi:MAG: hypothetical protein AB7S50_13720 [Bacteroidales bacterium]
MRIISTSGQSKQHFYPVAINRIAEYIHLSIAIATLLWLNVGIYAYFAKNISNNIKLFLFLTWFGYSCISRIDYLENFIKRSLPLMLFFLTLILITLLTGTSELRVLVLNMRYFFIVYSIFLFYEKDPSFQKIILSAIIIDMIIIGFNTFFALQINPNISRYLSTGSGVKEMLTGSAADNVGIGAFSYAYSLIFYCIYFFHRIIYTRKFKFIFVILFLIAVSLIINMQFTISLIILLASSFYIIYRKFSSAKYFKLTLVFSFTILLLIFSLLPYFFEYLYYQDLFPQHISDRLMDLSRLFSGRSLEGTNTAGRFSRYFLSINVFLENFFTGSLTDKIGEHSGWFDLLARLGLLSVTLYIFFIKEYFYIRNKLKSSSLIYYNACFLSYFLIGLFNPSLFSQIFLTVFLIVPYLSFTLKENK